MSVRLAGLGWVTPLGGTLDGVWAKLCAGETAAAQSLGDSLGTNECLGFLVPPSAIAEAPRHPRLRRASAISRYAVAAGLAALLDAGVELNAESAARTALVFAISNGGVIYTKRFYHEIVQNGAQAASPLLFPETVFNAPASHLAAILGITGATYTLVGDGAVGILALRMAEDLMSDPELDRCLVVGAEELDALVCDAYRRWRLIRARPPLEPFANPPRGALLSEGAGAILLARDGKIALEQIHPGGIFLRRNQLVRQLEKIVACLTTNEKPDLHVASANGTFIDAAEWEIATKFFPDAAIYAPKAALGESIAASGIWQTIFAALALRETTLPPPSLGSGLTNGERALVTSCGMNQQVAALMLRRYSRVA